MQKSSKNWVACVMVLATGWLLLYATRTVLSSALKDIGDYWHLSTSWLGILSSSFFFSYTILQVPSGFFGDKFGARTMLIVGFGIQALGLILGSLSQNQAQFLVSRLLTGAGQASYFACQQSIISVVTPKEKRAFGTSITVAGAGLGSALGFFVGKALSTGSFGWRMPFVVLGVLSLAFIGAVLALVPKIKRQTQPQTSEKEASSTADEVRTNISPVFLAFMCGAHFLTMYGFYVMLTWLPYYLETVRGIQGAFTTSMPVMMALVMSPSTVIAGLLFGKLKDKTLVSKIALPLSTLAIILVPVSGSVPLLAAALVLYGATGKLVLDPSLVYFVGESAPPQNRSTIFSIFNAAGALAMILAPAVTGFVAHATGSFNGSFYLAAALNFVALACFVAGVGIFHGSYALRSRKSVRTI